VDSTAGTTESSSTPNRTLSGIPGIKRHMAQRKEKPRSAITSGRKLFPTGNPNGAWSRRFADLVVGHMSDMGGADFLSDAQVSLIKRCASLECELERLDALMSNGELVDLDCYGRASSHLRRLFETLGVERKQRDVTPLTLEQFLAAHNQRPAEVGE
jgi:hypothetical protein